ncbi:MAG: choice-of-anchor Q domain-containing protein [Planctomycetota bacterium]
MKEEGKSRLIVSLFLLVIAAGAGAKTIYVDADAAGSGTGANWANAYKYLQDALADADASAKPVEIRVARGTYKPDEGAGVSDGDREATFRLINGVTLKGGYAGDGETDPNERDTSNNVTTLSGDLDGNDVPVPTSDLLTEPTRAENSYHVITGSGTHANAVLDGFTITAGNANGTVFPDNCGAGGMYAGNSTLLNCTFSNNSAGNRAGGLEVQGGDSMISNCTFINNSAEGSAGGMQVHLGQLTLTNCTFVGNSAGNDAGGLRIRMCDATLANCTFIGNSTGTDGGGVWTILLADQLARFINCTFSGNSASDYGGGFYSWHDFSEFTNCTFSGNLAGGDGGAYCISVNGGMSDFDNCIFWGNTASGEGPQIAIIATSSATVNVNYSDVQGNWLDIYDPYDGLVWGSGNIDVDPCFVDADGVDDAVGTEDDNLRLLADSNCIDAGDNTAVPADVNEDLAGNPRIIDGTVDLGAYESRPFIYVDADATGDNDGTSWANAYNYLQDGLGAAKGGWGEILVAEGTYRPDEGAGVTDGDREATFGLINGVTLKGGYAGDGEPDPNARDVASYETILSGDLDGNDVPVATSDLLTEPTRAENSYHVVTGSGTDGTAVLDGFTITAGNANETVSPNRTGAGMYSPDSAPTILNCTFSENSAYSGGGGLHRWDDLDRISTITNSIFNRNWAGGDGGGIFSGNMALTNCTFSGNSAEISAGGMYSLHNSRLTNCTFRENSAGTGGGGVVHVLDSPMLTNCAFINNYAGTVGGGMKIWATDEITLTNCTFSGNSAGTNGGGIFTLVLEFDITKFINCTFSGNSATSAGGGYYTSHDYPTFTNCTFSENEAGGDGGAFCISVNGGTPDFNNCIFWGNRANNEGPQIAIKSSGATVDVNYCDVQSGYWDIYVSAGTLNYGVNNINSDPLFVDADGADDTVGTEDDNLRLLSGSPCIDAGDNTAVPADTADLDGDGNTAEPTPLDLNGFARFIDDLCTSDTGNGTAPIVDMGAYEFLRSDINSNGSVDFEDYCVIADRWRETSCGLCGGADLTCDGNVDWNDVREIVAHWLSGQ